MKKKYLIKGTFALIFGAFVASCSDYDNDYTSIADAKQATFAENFVKFYGEIDPNQDWGFGTPAVSRMTRTVTSDFNFSAVIPTKPTTTQMADANFKTNVRGITQYTYGSAGRASGTFYVTGATDINIWGANGTGGELYFTGECNLSGKSISIAANTIIYLVSGAQVTLDNGFNADCKIFIGQGAKLTIKNNIGTGNVSYYIKGGSFEAKGNLVVNGGKEFFVENGSVKVGGEFQLENATYYAKSTPLEIGDKLNLIQRDNAALFYNEDGIISCEGQLLNNSSKFYTNANSYFSEISENGNCVAYNGQGARMTTGIIRVTNSNSDGSNGSVLINDGTLAGTYLGTEGGAFFQNNGTTTISGNTVVNSNNNTWVNNGTYNTGYFNYTAGSTQVINNCRLNVDEDFNMNLGDTDRNAFRMDANCGVVTKNLNLGGGFGSFTGGPFYITMGSGSVFEVTQTATINATKENYGIYGPSTGEYAVLHANLIRCMPGQEGQGYKVTYGGSKLAIISETTHFEQGASGQYPYIDFKENCTIVNIYASNFNSVQPSITIPSSTCNPGFPKGSTDEGDLNIIDAGTGSDSNIQQWEIKKVLDHKRVFCEDLGSSSNRKDYDYNDVVFDAKIIESSFVNKTFEGTTLTSTSSEYGTNYYAEITVLAAGGELSLTVGGEEVNGLFKKPTSMIINTVSEADMETFVASHPEKTLNPVTFNYTFNSLGEATIKNIPVMVKMDNVPVYLKAEKGEAPQKICVPVGTRWAYERVPIDEAYGNFKQWIGHVNDFTPATLWGTNYDEGKLYPQMGATVDETGSETESFVKYIESNTGYTFTLSDEETIVFNQSGNEGQDLSSTPIIINNSFFSSSEKGSIVRLYGVDTGNADVTVMAGDVALGNTTRGDGKAYIYTLSTSQAASAKANGLSITGSGFRLYYVTVDNSDIDRTVEIEPTFTNSEIAGIAITFSPTPLNTGINIPNSNFANAGAGTEVYVYGTGDETSVNVSVNGSNLSKASSRQTRGTTYVKKTKKNVKFTMTAEQAAAAQTYGITITGSDFVLHAVGVVIVEGGSGTVQIWPNTGTGSETNEFTIAGNKFTDNMANMTLRIYSSEFNINYWQITVTPINNIIGNDFQGLTIAHWNNNNSHLAATSSSGAKNESKQCIEMTLTSDLITIFKNKSIKINPQGLNITKVTVE